MSTLIQHSFFASLFLLIAGEFISALPPDRASLQRELRSEDTEQRFQAALVLLRGIDPKHKDALGVLRDGLRANVPRHSESVIDLARHNPVVLKLLIEIGLDRNVDSQARISVLNELEELAPLVQGELPQFIKCLDESDEIAASTAEVLGSMKREAKAAIPALEKRIKNDRTPFWQVDTCVARMAHSLVQIDPGNKGATDYFTRLLTGWDYDIRSEGVYGLRDCPTLPPEALKRLKRIAEKDPYDNLRSVAAAIVKKQEAARGEKKKRQYKEK